MRVIFAVIGAQLAVAQTVAVLPQANIQRTGAYTSEAILTKANIQSGAFHRLYQLPVDGTVRAAPVIVEGVTVSGANCVGTAAATNCNVLYVGTQNNTLYAYDANQTTATAPLWSVNFGSPDQTYTTGTYFIMGGKDTTSRQPIGILAAPVPDEANGNLWVSYATADHNMHLRAVKLATGADAHADIVVAATAAGCGGTCTFTPSVQKIVVPLARSGGTVYLITSSHNDNGTYQSWFLGYDTTSFAKTVTFCGGTNGSSTSSWMSGQGMAVLADGSIVFINGTGTRDGSGNWGDTIIRVNTSGAVQTSFTPWNQAALSAADIELGSSGPLIIPNPNTASGTAILFAGKEGCIDVWDPAANTGIQTGTSACNSAGLLQAWLAMTTSPATSGSGFFSGALAFGDNVLFAGPSTEIISAYAYDSGTGLFATSAFATSAVAHTYATAFAYSSNAGATGTKLLHVLYPLNNQAGCCSGPTAYQSEDGGGVYEILDATTLTKIWDSKTTPGDGMGINSKWQRPVIYRGKVFLTSMSPTWPLHAAYVNVYGLKPPAWK